MKNAKERLKKLKEGLKAHRPLVASVAVYLVIVVVGLAIIGWRRTDSALHLHAGRPLAKGHRLAETDVVTPARNFWNSLLQPAPSRLTDYFLRDAVARNRSIRPRQLTSNGEITLDGDGWLLTLTVTGWLAENVSVGDRVTLVASNPAPAAPQGAEPAAAKPMVDAAQPSRATSPPRADKKPPAGTKAAPPVEAAGLANTAPAPPAAPPRERIVADDIVVRAVRREPAAEAGKPQIVKAVLQVPPSPIDIPDGVTVRLKQKYGGK